MSWLGGWHSAAGDLQVIGKTSNQPVLDRVRHSYSDDGDDAGRLLGKPSSWGTQRHNEVTPAFHKFGREFAEAIGIRPSELAFNAL